MAEFSGMTIIGIVVGSIFGAMSLLGGGIYLYNYRRFGTPIRELAIITAAKSLYYFIPYTLFLVGVVNDGLNGQFKYSPAGFIGLLAVFLNYITSSAIGSRIVDPDVCGIPGMSQMGSGISPQNMLFSTTVLSYITATNVTLDPTSLNNLIPGITLAVLFLLQLLMHYLNGCNTQPWVANWFNGAFPPILALLGGVLIGGAFGWGFTILINPEKNPNNE